MIYSTAKQAAKHLEIGVVVKGRGYVPSLFIQHFRSDDVYCFNREMGFFKHPNNLEEIEKHFQNMLNEGFTLESLNLDY